MITSPIFGIARLMTSQNSCSAIFRQSYSQYQHGNIGVKCHDNSRLATHITSMMQTEFSWSHIVCYMNHQQYNNIGNTIIVIQVNWPEFIFGILESDLSPHGVERITPRTMSCCSQQWYKITWSILYMYHIDTRYIIMDILIPVLCRIF